MADLIKREDVLKVISRCKHRLQGNGLTYDIMLDMFQSIPSADTDLSGYSDKLWKNAYERGKADRPQGEWIRTGRTNVYGGIEAQCSNCGDKVMVQHLEDEWYCRHCGADMGMKGADDEY